LKTLCPDKDLYVDVHSSIIHNRKKKQNPPCSSAHEWRDKKSRIHTIEYYSPIKRSKLWMHDKTWMNLENNILWKRHT